MSNRLIEKMMSGDKSAITDALTHSGAIYRINAICFATLSKIDSEEVVCKLRDLQKDDVMLDGFTVSDFATAALSLLGIEKYSGDKDSIKRLISSRFEFMRD